MINSIKNQFAEGSYWRMQINKFQPVIAEYRQCISIRLFFVLDFSTKTYLFMHTLSVERSSSSFGKLNGAQSILHWCHASCSRHLMVYFSLFIICSLSFESSFSLSLLCSHSISYFEISKPLQLLIVILDSYYIQFVSYACMYCVMVNDEIQ